MVTARVAIDYGIKGILILDQENQNLSKGLHIPEHLEISYL